MRPLKIHQAVPVLWRDASHEYIRHKRRYFDTTRVCEAAWNALDLTRITQVSETPLGLRRAT